jgi:hypothetical protein
MWLNNNFIRLLTDLPSEPDYRALHQQIGGWLQHKERYFKTGRDYYESAVQLSHLQPLETFSSEVKSELKETIRSLIRVPAGSASSLAMGIRDLLWLLVATEGLVVINGEEIAGYFLWDSTAEQVVFETLGLSRWMLVDTQGRPYEPQSQPLLPASKAQILRGNRHP